MHISLIIPAYNEEDRLPSTLEYYRQALHMHFDGDFEIIVVANGCRDNTAAIAQEIAQQHEYIHVIVIQEAVGKGGAVLEGFRQACGDRIIFADADAATDSASLLDLLDQLDDHDVAIGSRRLSTSTIVRRQPLLRQVLGFVFALIVRLLFAMPYCDTQCGAKAFKRDAAQKLAKLVAETRWAFDVDLLLWAAVLQLTVIERPVIWTDKAGSRLRALSVGREVLQALWRMKVRHGRERQPGVPGALPQQSKLSILALNWRCLRHPQAGGAEVNIFEQARRWVADGHSVTLVCADPGRAHTRLQDDVIDGILVRRMGNRFSIYLRVALYLLRHVDQFDCIVDISNGIPFFSPLFSRTPSILYVHHLHDRQWFREFPYPIAVIGWLLERYIVPLVYRKRSVVAVSSTTASALTQIGFDASQIEIVYNGVAQPLELPVLQMSECLRIAYVGRIKRYKRIDLLVKAVAALHPQFPQLHLDIVGDGDALPEVKTLIERLGLHDYVTLHGFVDDQTKAAILRHATVFVTPSMHEGWGISVIEANSYACPAVAYDVPGLQVAIRHNETGLLARDDQGFQEAIAAILTDPTLRESLSAEALSWSTMFTWDACAAGTMRVLSACQRRQPWSLLPNQLESVLQ